LGRILGTHDPARVEQGLRLYRERFSMAGLFENRVYPGVPEMLASLNRVGYRLFIATSKPFVYARSIIQHFKLAEYFAGVYGSELDGRLENTRDLVRFAVESENLRRPDTAIVGDRGQDMFGAKGNAFCGVGVTWGYGSDRELRDAGADVICDAPSEVVRFLTEP
jgi:phosphoglycolate phosphatase